MNTLPEDRQQPDAFEALCQAHEKKNSDSVIHVDMWPFSAPLMIVCSPVLAVQACSQELNLSKPPMLHAFFNPLAGGENLFTMNGLEWKWSRSLFNPAFSGNYLLQLTSHIVDEAEVYVDILREYARKGDIFSLDDITCWYLLDVIGAVTLDARLHSASIQPSRISAAPSNRVACPRERVLASMEPGPPICPVVQQLPNEQLYRQGARQTLYRVDQR